MEQWLVILVLFIITGIFVAAMIPVLSYIWQQQKVVRQQRTVYNRKDSKDADIIDMEAYKEEDGTTVATPPESRKERVASDAENGKPKKDTTRVRIFRRFPPFRLPTFHLPREVVLGMAGIALLLLAGFWYWSQVQMQLNADKFVVLVAPFDDAGNGQTGVAVAHDLMRLLHAEGSHWLVVRQLDIPPVDEQDALDAAAQQMADVVVWGNVQPGGWLHTASLQPRFTYTPTGAYVPNAWAGYSGRFMLPHTFAIADAPINGETVLPRLLFALADYSTGTPDAAYDLLGQLLADYPLNPVLPRVLRGNILWARGSYAAAADEYRQALARSSNDAVEQAKLLNNLGAILLDAGDSSAAEVLNQAEQHLNGASLGALHFNRGILAQQQNRLGDARVELEQARKLSGDNTPLPLLLALAWVDRENGQLLAADKALDTVEQQTDATIDRVPQSLEMPVRLSLQSMLLEQRALLRLSQLIDARGRLTWELEVASPQTPDALQPALDALRGAEDATRKLSREWQQRATADEVALNLSRSESGAPRDLVANGQVQAAERALTRQQYELALVLIEQGQALQVHPRNFLVQVWGNLFGPGEPTSEALRLLNAQSADSSNAVSLLLAHARALRLPGPEQDIATAAQRYDQAVAIAPERPEGYYGKGILASGAGDREGTRQLMTQALERDAWYFPARLYLVDLAEQERDWGTVILHLRLLAEQYPGDRATIALAEALRQSGPSGYAESETLLLPLANGGNVAAMIELGRLYRDNAMADEAIAAFEHALEKDPHSAIAELELGRLLVQQGAFEQARAQFLAAITDGRGEIQTQAHMAVAELYAGPLDNSGEASRHYAQVINSHISDTAMLITAGDWMLKHHQYQVALKAWQRANQLQPDNPGIDARLSRVYLALNNTRMASGEAQQVLVLTGSGGQEEIRALALVSLGDVQRLSGNLDNAVPFYNDALVLDPAQVEATLGLGLVAVARNNWAVALGHFERAVTLPEGQEHALAQFWYAEALLRQHNLVQAIEHYNRALALQTPFPEALLGKAQVEYMQGRADEAYTTVEQALQQRPEYAEGLLFKGKLLQEDRRRLAEALDAYSRAIRANNQLGDAFYRRGVVFLQQENHEAAIRDLERAVELQPDNAEVLYWMGRAYRDIGRNDAALAAFRRAVGLRDGNYIEALYYQGLVEAAQGQDEAASNTFSQVIQLSGEGEWAIQARTELERIGQQ